MNKQANGTTTRARTKQDAKKKSVSRLEFKTSAVKKNCTQNRVRGKERVSGKNEQTTIHIMK